MRSLNMLEQVMRLIFASPMIHDSPEDTKEP
jgi:hypothetical protein